jgi:hypothetical protein
MTERRIPEDAGYGDDGLSLEPGELDIRTKAVLVGAMLNERVALSRELRRRPMNRIVLLLLGRRAAKADAREQDDEVIVHTERRVEAETIVRADRIALFVVSDVPRLSRLAAREERSRPELEVAAALDRLERTMDAGSSHVWMLSSNAELDDRRPVDLLDEGRFDEVLDLIEHDCPLPD